MARKDSHHPKKNGGFLESLLHSLSLQSAIELSRKKGKPDPYAAAGIAAAMGHTSVEDTLRLGEMLAQQGAFDKNAPDLDSSWQDECEDDWEHGIFPVNYDTRKEYEEALEEARYGWRDTCETDLEHGILPENYKTKREYEEALEEARHGWRKTRRADWKHGIFPEDYETEEEFEEALEEARHGWRNTCEPDWEHGVFPEHYETRQEYEAALEEARYAWRDAYEGDWKHGIFPEHYETEEEYRTALRKARYGWRETCEDGSDYGIDPEDYETEEEYEDALEEAEQDELDDEDDSDEETQDNELNCPEASAPVLLQLELRPMAEPVPDELPSSETEPDAVAQPAKNHWRSQYESVARNTGIDPGKYESEMEYKAAVTDALKARQERYAQQAARTEQADQYKDAVGACLHDDSGEHAGYPGRNTFRKVSIHSEPRDLQNVHRVVQTTQGADAHAVYTYCGIRFSEYGKTYHYRSENDPPKVGQQVMVPVGDDARTATGTVVSVGQYRADAVPFPLEKTRCILPKLPQTDTAAEQCPASQREQMKDP